MASRYISGAAGLALGLGLAATPAFAQGSAPTEGAGAPGAGAPSAGHPSKERPSKEHPSAGQPGAAGGYGAGMEGYGAGVPGGMGAPGEAGAEGEAGATGATGGMAAPIPQFWFADASMFIGSAANAAHVLSLEEGLNEQAPQVLGNQAQFLLAATNRALASLEQLEQNAEATKPSAVPGIRAAIGQLVSARAQATQAAAAVREGQLGPTFATTVRSSLGHLAAAEREMSLIGRAYAVPQFATASVCSAGRAFAYGAGIGRAGERATPKAGTPAPKGGTPSPKEGMPTPKEGGTTAPEGEPGTPAKP
jgi:hypothetical protein